MRKRSRKPGDTIRVIGYVRVSTAEQAVSGAFAVFGAVPGAVFKLIVAFPVEVFGTVPATQTRTRSSA